MPTDAPLDPITELAVSWQHELPDLDVEAMATIALLNRVRALAIRRVEDALDAAGSSLADFDVLSTLRRCATPHRMMPSTLARSVMLSASGMTSRIDHLEQTGLVRRVVDPDNRRTAPVELTERGVNEAERLVRLVVDVDGEILTSLSDRQRVGLDRALTTIMRALDPAD